MWALIDGVAGIMLGCVAALAILAIRVSASRAVVTWRMSEAPASHDKKAENILV